MEGRKSNIDLQAVLQAFRDAVFCMDLSGNVIYWNSAAEKLYGYTASEIIGKSILQLIPESHHIEKKKLFEKILWGNEIENYETDRIRKDGTLIHVGVSLSAIKAEDGRILGILSVSRDVSHRKLAESKSQALLESAPDAMVVVNRLGQIILVNAQTENLFGYRREELIGQDVEILIPDRFKDIHPDHRKNFFAAPKTRAMGAGLELFGRKKDGSEFSVEISLSPLKLEDGFFVSAAIRDTTEKKKTTEALKEYASKLEISNKELGQFAYVASHDLQEPLRTITNYVGLLEDKLEGRLDKKETKFFHYVASAANRMKVLIKDLLEFSRIGRNRTIEKVNCSDIVSEVLEDMELAISESGAEINVGKLPVIYTSRTEMKQVFQNIIANAIKFRKENATPEISIRAEEKRTEWQFAIQDNGIGIDEEYENKVFMLFQRLHASDEYPGTGIGLATCKKIIEMNGGKIWLESEPGLGSTFYFTVPKKSI